MAAVAVKVRGDDCFGLGLEETELRLGLPGDLEAAKNSSGKRGFAETIDLKLKLPIAGLENARQEVEVAKKPPGQKSLQLAAATDPERPPAPKAQVVGWPPVRSYRKNIMTVQAEKSKRDEGENSANNHIAAFVKVSMDGAPYLRKVDLKMYKSYRELSTALEKMFSSFSTIGGVEGGSNEINFMNENKLMSLLSGSEYVPTYEDKDGDWMLVGDVPWEMFVDSCKRLRIMKGSEATGLAPRSAKEKNARTEAEMLD